MKATTHILYLDDEADNLVAFKAVFRRFYTVHTAQHRAEALAVLAREPIQIVLSDQRMPDCTGVAFLEEVHHLYPDCIRMIITGYGDIQAAIEAINRGKVYHYITKPWNMDELKIVLDNALETYALRRQNEQLEAEKQALIILNLQREREHLHSRFEVLKNQINPHFLFNSLNTLASLIASDAQAAIRFTTRFAKMYRSLLELGEQQLIPLARELELIETYLSLQKIRFGEHIVLHVDVPDQQFVIPPFALQLLVENAIKHNRVDADHPLHIRIVAQGDALEVANTLQLRAPDENSMGIGLQNLEQRYQVLIQRGIAYRAEAGMFRVVLPLIPNA